MSRKRILNITTTKKRDQMMTVTNLDGNPSGGTLIPNPTANSGILVGNSDVYVLPWIATYRRRNPNQYLATARNAETCFMRGLKEHVRIQTNSPLPWKWRRVCFTLKGDFLAELAPSGTLYYDNWDSIGNVRLVSQTNAIFRSAMDRILFKGSFGKDYRNYIDAVLDTDTVNVKCDKTMSIHSGNQQGVWRTFDMWHPMNKNLVYGDDESGDGVSSTGFSTPSKLGMGDYYIVDMIQPSLSGVNTDRLLIDITSTLYWHEK